MGPYRWPSPQWAAELSKRLDDDPLGVARQYGAGQWVATLMALSGMSNDELAARLKVNHSTVSRLLRAEREGRVTLAKLEQAAEALDATLVYALVPNAGFVDRCQNRYDEMARNRRLHRRLKDRRVLRKRSA